MNSTEGEPLPKNSEVCAYCGFTFGEHRAETFQCRTHAEWLVPTFTNTADKNREPHPETAQEEQEQQETAAPADVVTEALLRAKGAASAEPQTTITPTK